MEIPTEFPYPNQNQNQIELFYRFSVIASCYKLPWSAKYSP